MPLGICEEGERVCEGGVSGRRGCEGEGVRERGAVSVCVCVSVCV